MNRRLGVTLAAAASLLFGAPVMAAPLHLRGNVIAISANTITVHTANGDVSTSLRGDTAFVSVVHSSPSHVETGGYVGVVSKNVGNRLIALSVIVFPAAMRGASEGHAAYDVIPDTTLSGSVRTASSMTNANVKAISAPAGAPRVNSTMSNGNVTTATESGGMKLLTLTYKGGEQHIILPPTAPIVAFVPGTASIVSPGEPVFVQADESDGKATAILVAVGSHGLTPPF